MIYRDSVTVQFFTSTGTGGAGFWTSRAEEVPCELVPLNTDPANTGATVTTRYRLLLDAAGLVDSGYGLHGGQQDRLLYRGSLVLAVDGALEVHRVGGRLHHYEAVVKAFGVGTVAAGTPGGW